jgi:hypothetical protein
MALFTILIVALVVGLTWWDWRDIQRKSGFPQWVGSLALAGIVAACVTGFTSMSSILYVHTVGELRAGFGSPAFWPEAGFLLCGLGVIIVAVRKKSARTLLILASVLIFGLVLGLALYA